MSADNRDSAQLTVERVTKLEELFTHLQRTVHDLDQVVLQQQRLIDALRKELLALSQRLEAATDLEAEEESGDDARPIT